MLASSALSGAAVAAEAPGEIRLGVASYSFREFSRRLCIKFTKELNCPYLSIKEFHAPYRSTDEELARARAEFEKAGLPLTGGSTIYIQKEDPADVKSYFEYAKKLGMPMMTIGATAKTLPLIEKMAIQYDMKIACHNHGPEDKHFPAPSDILKEIKNMDPRMGLCVDIGHTTRTGKDLLTEIEAAGPRLLDVHVKDLKDLKVSTSQCDVGEGAMPIVAMFKLLKKMKYAGIVHLEYEINGENPLPGMQKSFAYMRGVIAGMKG